MMFRKEAENAMPHFSLPSNIDLGLPSQFCLLRDKLLNERERCGVSARLAHNPQLFCALLQLLRTSDVTCEWGKAHHSMMLLLWEGEKGCHVTLM